MSGKRVCKDCYPDGHGVKSSMVPSKPRPAPYPGPRCATHHRAKVKADKARAHENRVRATYGLERGEYTALKDFQGGMCAICLRATGAARRLSVDHDHKTGLVRGLLCRPCNDLLGHARDQGDFFRRCIDYLADPPYWRLYNGPRSASDEA